MERIREEMLLKTMRKKFEKSYDEIFYRLEHLYSEADRKDDKLFDIVADFAMLHDDIYFEAGVLVGFQLFKNLEQEYQKHGEDSILNIVLKPKGKKSVLEEIAGYRMDTALEETLRTDKKYQEATKRISEKVKRWIEMTSLRNNGKLLMKHYRLVIKKVLIWESGTHARDFGHCESL